MKSRPLLVFILILSLAVVPSLQLALAASSSSTTTTTTTSSTPAPKSPYSERLDIYTAGSNAYWKVSLSPVNATKPAIVSAESVSGMSAYQLTAVKTSSARPSSQLFWADGFKVIKLPFMPDAGVFLNVTASSQSEAQSAASEFNSLLGANFLQIASGGGNYTFFSPAAFATAGATIFSYVPAANKGLASISSASTLANQQSPTATLTGVRSGSSFTHTVSFGSTQTGTITNGSLILGSVLNQPNATFTSSPNATSTQVVVHALDSLISSKDSAKITNSQSSFSGTYSVDILRNSRIFPNVTLLPDPPVLTATRILDRGSASSGDLVSVTLLLKNIGQGTAVQNIAMNDSWWRAYPSLFSFSAGNSSFTIPSLAAGQNVSRVYVLKVTSSAPEDLTLPSSSVAYSYNVGSVTVTATTQTNQVELRTNSIGPALIIQAGTDIKSGAAIGTVGHYLITVTNVGNGPALNLQVANFTNPTLTQGGGVWKFNSTIPITSIVGRNVSQTFTVAWTAPDGSKGSLVSNPANLVLSHSGVVVPLMQFSMSSTLSPGVLKLGTANATYTLTNAGSATAGNVTVAEKFATGVGCSKVLNGTATCNPSGLSLNAGPVAPGASVLGKVLVTFSKDNYMTQPGLITTTSAGLTLHTAGNAFMIPAGVLVTKTYATNPVFEGQNDTVTVHVVNQGSLPVFNMSVTTSSDGFDAAFEGKLQDKYPTLGPNSAQSFNYTVEIFNAGNHTTATTSASFTFGGSAQTYTYTSGNVLVYRLVIATTKTMPSIPVEGDDFELFVDVRNPSAVNVTNVSLSIPIPRGLTIVNASSGVDIDGRTVKLSLPSLLAGATSNHSIILRAGSGGSTKLGTGTLTFQYLGETIQGVVLSPAVVVGIDLLIRYEIPIGLAVVLTIAVAVYMHRKPTVPQAK